MEQYRRELIEAAALRLDFNKMIRYNRINGTFNPTDLGRIASYYYIRSATIEASHRSVVEVSFIISLSLHLGPERIVEAANDR